MAEITYAKVDGPPDDWMALKVIDLDAGQEVRMVLEVNTFEGWLIRNRADDGGEPLIDPDKPDEVAKERIEGRFEIIRPA